MTFYCDVNNVPEKLVLCKYIVATLNDKGELWYWGTWEDYDRAVEVAQQLKRGVVVRRDE